MTYIEGLRTGAWRLVPAEADEMAIEAMREAFRRARRGGVSGMTIDAQWRSENAPELSAYNAMLSASPDATAALLAEIEGLRGALEPAGWQRRRMWAVRTDTVDESPWESCSAKQATDIFERQAGYEYRRVFAHARATKDQPDV